MTNVNTVTEDFSAKELNGVLQLLLIFFRRLAIYTRDTVLACNHELTFQFEQLTHLLCVCMSIVSAGAHIEVFTFPPPCSSGNIQGCRTWGNLSWYLHT